MTFGLTLLPLLHLEGEVEGTDGEVDGLGVGLAHGAEEVEDVGALATDQTGQQLGNPGRGGEGRGGEGRGGGEWR